MEWQICDLIEFRYFNIIILRKTSIQINSAYDTRQFLKNFPCSAVSLEIDNQLLVELQSSQSTKEKIISQKKKQNILVCYYVIPQQANTHTASVPILTSAREIHQFLRSLCCSQYLRLPNNIASVKIKYMNKSISYFYLFPSLLHFFHSNVFDLPPTHTPTQWHGGGILCPRSSGEKRAAEINFLFRVIFPI